MAKETLQMELKIPSGPDVVTWVLKSGRGGRSEGQRETLMGKRQERESVGQWSPTLLAPGISFIEDNFFH